MKLFGTLTTCVSDDEYVETLRRSVATADRWRFWLILLQAVVLITVVAVFATFIPNLIWFAKPANIPIAFFGLAMGTMIGFSFGWMIHNILSTLLSVLTGMRTERLLIKHYDAVKVHEREEQESD